MRLLAGEHPIAVDDDGPGLRWRRERDRADRLARCDCRQQLGAVALGTGERDEARGADGGRRERAGVDRAPELLEHDGHVDHPHARASVGLGHQQPGDAERAQAGPHVVGRAALVVEHLAHVSERRALGSTSGRL